jgi:hypothetical protein
MKFISIIFLYTFFVCTLFSDEGRGQALEQMPPELETEFALSALPAPLRAQATVYTLDPEWGYVLKKKGTNAWTCLVERTEWVRVDYRNDIYTPLCYDKVGTAQHLRVWMDVASLRAKGVDAINLKTEILSRFKTGTYSAPTRSGFSYMVAPLMRTYPNPDPSDKNVITMTMPHIMYYAPGITNVEFNAILPPEAYPFVLDQGPHGYFIQLIGEAEKAKIVQENAALLKRLCAYRTELCLSAQSGSHKHQ